MPLASSSAVWVRVAQMSARLERGTEEVLPLVVGEAAGVLARAVESWRSGRTFEVDRSELARALVRYDELRERMGARPTVAAGDRARARRRSTRREVPRWPGR